MDEGWGRVDEEWVRVDDKVFVEKSFFELQTHYYY